MMNIQYQKKMNTQHPTPNVQRSTPNGFTLLELMLAITILSLVATVTYMTFATVIKAWSRGSQLTEELHRGDFVVEQIMLGLRSAYYPESNQKDSKYGFWMEDNGDDESAEDDISWVALGSALIGKENVYFGSPHRIRVTIEDDEDGETGVAIRSWRVKGQDEDFEPEDIEPVFLSTRMVGMNCRVAYEMEDDELDWLDEWEETNRVPKYVELTLYMEPLDSSEDAVELKRVVKISAGDLCWDEDGKAKSAPENTDSGTNNDKNNTRNTQNSRNTINNRNNTRNTQNPRNTRNDRNNSRNTQNPRNTRNDRNNSRTPGNPGIPRNPGN